MLPKICIYFTHHSHLLLYLQFTMLLWLFLNNQIALYVCTALLGSQTLLTEMVVLKTFTTPIVTGKQIGRAHV